MNLINQINNCNSDYELECLVRDAIVKKNEEASKIEIIEPRKKFFKGFIPLDTTIYFSDNIGCSYNMNTTDYFYEFIKYLKKKGVSNISDIYTYELVDFINQYFGHFDCTISREDVLKFSSVDFSDALALLDAIDSQSIGDFKGKCAAQCSERSALVQEILSLFGIESYYCHGAICYNGHIQYHSYNLINVNGVWHVYDSSLPVLVYNGYTNKIIKCLPYFKPIKDNDLESFLYGKTVLQESDCKFVYMDKLDIVSCSDRYYSCSYNLSNMLEEQRPRSRKPE